MSAVVAFVVCSVVTGKPQLLIVATALAVSLPTINTSWTINGKIDARV